MRITLLITTILSGVLLLISNFLPVKAQTTLVLHTFALAHPTGGVLGVETNRDGINPNGWLTLSATTLYGAAQSGGTNGSGTLFALNANGAFSILYNFLVDTNNTLLTATNNSNLSGASPNGGLALVGTNLYGTTFRGGSNDVGVVFSITTNGTGINLLHTFSVLNILNSLGFYINPDGANPAAGLVLAQSSLFGTAQNGGFHGNGVVFACTTSGNFTVLHQFTLGNFNTNSGLLTNIDGANPTCQLLLSGSTLYGTTAAGGTNGYGTIFDINTNGTGFTVLHEFDTNGANPYAGLVLANGTLFGVGGSIVYALGTNGAGFTILQQFGFGTNLDAVPPQSGSGISGLTVSNGTLYGVAGSVGANDTGQIFSLNTNGLGYMDFHDFSALPVGVYPPPPQTNSDGAIPSGGLVLFGDSLYGAASEGGTNANGVLFRVSPPATMLSPQLYCGSFLLSFQTLGGMSYTVQEYSNLTETNWVAFTNIIGSSGVAQFTLPATNAAPQFFRVSQP